MLTDSAYPSNGLIRLTFRGTVDEQQLCEAIDRVLPSHPMFSARLEPRRFRPGFRWVQTPDVPTVNFFTKLLREDPSELEGLQDICESDLPCLRFVFRKGEKLSVLQFQWHHACSDALGAFAFLSDVLKTYRGDLDLQNGDSVRDHRLLRLRYSSGFPQDSAAVFLWKHLIASLRFVWIRLRKIRPLVEHQPSPIGSKAPADYPAALSHRFSAEETDRIRGAAKQRNVSVNTLLLSTMFRVLNALRKVGGATRDDWLRVSIPVNNRPPEQSDSIPAANVISIAYIDRRSRDIDNTPALIRSLHREMKEIRSNHHAAQFAFTLNGLSFFDGFIASGVRSRRCTTTSLLTNMGRVLSEMPETQNRKEVQLPEATLGDVEIIPPIRPGQTVTVSAYEYAGRMKLSMAYDSRIHSREEAALILRLYVMELESFGLVTESDVSPAPSSPVESPGHQPVV